MAVATPLSPTANQLISWGPSQVWTPVDFVNLQRSNPFSSIDLRVGKPGLRLHLPMEGSDLFLFADLSDNYTQIIIIAG